MVSMPTTKIIDRCPEERKHEFGYEHHQADEIREGIWDAQSPSTPWVSGAALNKR